ncbi:ATP-binding cassette domain-containing protein [Aequorivita sp. Q41]|uniref:ATP-binding cassette domain-containing protein n=1 Tax=Aequorivita sp. Q41 TaxID=3153300 RepID=UPI003242712F
MALIQLYSASKTYGKKEIIKNVSFSLETGTILGVFGRNGCGKSTLLKMIFGTVIADSIKISFDNNSFNPRNTINNRQIAYLPQFSFLPKNIKVRDLIPIYFSDEKAQDAIFYDPLIATFTAKKVSALSLGQVRYLEVLLVGTSPHPFIMFDEPFSMVDPLYKIEITNFLNKLKVKKGILITDHHYDAVLNITTQNLLIKNGMSHSIESKESLKEFKYLSENSI